MTLSAMDADNPAVPHAGRSMPKRQYTTVTYPPDMYRRIKARARRNGVSVRDETLSLCAIALRTDDPSFSPVLAPHAQDIVDALNEDAAELGGDRRNRMVGHMLDAARMIRKLATQVTRLRG